MAKKVEMDVRIDQTWHDGETVRIDDLRALGHCQPSLVADRHDLVVLDQHDRIRAGRAAESVDQESADDRHRRSRRRSCLRQTACVAWQHAEQHWQHGGSAPKACQTAHRCLAPRATVTSLDISSVRTLSS